MKTPTNTAPAALLFNVCRPCEDSFCPEGTFVCSCHGAMGVAVDVDELTIEEERHFRAHGSAAQKATITAFYNAPTLPDLTAAEHAYLDAAA